MLLWLTHAQAAVILQYTMEALPSEVCGIIGGIGNRAERIVPIPNIANDMQRQFQLDERVFVSAMFDFERDGLDLIAIYHSHPGGEAIPSQTDIRHATYPDTTYLIVGLKGNKPALGAWKIRGNEVNTVELHIGSDMPKQEDEPLSSAQKTAILLAALIGVLFVLLISFSLLPPAPIIITPLP